MLGLQGRQKRRNRPIIMLMVAALTLGASVIAFSGTAFAASQLVVAGPESATAGTTVDLCVDLVDEMGAPDGPDVAGAVDITLTSSPAATSITPAAGLTDYAGGDVCNNDFVFNKTGTYTITATASGTAGGEAIVAGTWVVTVTADVVDELTCSVPATATAGVPFSFTITFIDQFGNVSSNGLAVWQTLEFFVTPEDAANVLPGTTFLSPSSGTYTFSATLWTSGAILVEESGTPADDSVCPGILVTAAAAPAPAGAGAAAGAAAATPKFTG
jgi:hypothetical protein